MTSTDRARHDAYVQGELLTFDAKIREQEICDVMNFMQKEEAWFSTFKEKFPDEGEFFYRYYRSFHSLMKSPVIEIKQAVRDKGLSDLEKNPDGILSRHVTSRYDDERHEVFEKFMKSSLGHDKEKVGLLRDYLQEGSDVAALYMSHELKALERSVPAAKLDPTLVSFVKEEQVWFQSSGHAGDVFEHRYKEAHGLLQSPVVDMDQRIQERLLRDLEKDPDSVVAELETLFLPRTERIMQPICVGL